MQEIASQGLTIKEAKTKEMQLNLNSASLVTPNDLRPYLPGQADERRMLLDQVLALQSFNNNDKIIFELDGIEIPVKVRVNTFNFGVNALANTFKMGIENQYKQNLQAMQGLRQQLEDFHGKIEKEINQLKAPAAIFESQDSNTLKKLLPISQRIDYLSQLTLNSRLLMLDIECLMTNKKAYLANDNQYEIGSKILNLSNLIDQSVEFFNENKSLADRMTGYKYAFNCMSGKDRTGFMDAVAKTFAIMAEANKGTYPSHEDLQKNPKIRQEFV